MTDEETLFQFLDRRRGELENQLVALIGQANRIEQEIENRKKELAQIQKISESTQRPRLPKNISARIVSAPRSLGRMRTTDAMPPEVAQQYAQMTIKACAVQALCDKFPEGGTAAQIRDFIRDAYGRTIAPSSLRPQMSRLKADGVLTHEPAKDIWNLVPAKRTLYLMYDHPSSRKAMQELKDDPEQQSSESDA
jgi:hypothetical protein